MQIQMIVLTNSSWQKRLKGVTNDIYFDNTGYNGNVLFDVSAIDNYAHDDVLQETVIATWNPKSGFNLTRRYLFPNTFKNFQNITIKIGVIKVGILSAISTFSILPQFPCQTLHYIP